MTKYVDFYKLLQVHHLADSEVIEGAYKKLCKKYHPDVNKSSNAEEKFKAINEAYGILSNPESRKLFDLEYNNLSLKGNNDSGNSGYRSRVNAADYYQGALHALNSYFDGLISGDYRSAYFYISHFDKTNITEEDFRNWQLAVSRLYEIKSYKCVYLGKGSLKSNHDMHARIHEFGVVLEELDKRSGLSKSVEMSRSVVEDVSGYRIYLGYSDVKDITKKLLELSDDYIDESHESYDRPEALLELQREILRSHRYDRPFTAIFLEVNVEEEELKEKTILEICNFMQKNIRNTDYFSRWSKNRLMLILPETRIYGGRKTAEKLFDKIRRKLDCQGLSINAGIVQNKNLYLQEMLDLLSACLINSLKRGHWSISY